MMSGYLRVSKIFADNLETAIRLAKRAPICSWFLSREENSLYFASKLKRAPIKKFNVIDKKDFWLISLD